MKRPRIKAPETGQYQTIEERELAEIEREMTLKKQRETNLAHRSGVASLIPAPPPDKDSRSWLELRKAKQKVWYNRYYARHQERILAHEREMRRDLDREQKDRRNEKVRAKLALQREIFGHSYAMCRSKEENLKLIREWYHATIEKRRPALRLRQRTFRRRQYALNPEAARIANRPYEKKYREKRKALKQNKNDD